MFYIVGIGLNPRQITIEAIEAIEKCNYVYIDDYTSKLTDGGIEELEKRISKNITRLNRKEIEQDMGFLKDGSCLLVIGNPFSATTHYAIVGEARKRGLETKVIAGVSIFNYRGACGLFEYKFGKTTSIVYQEANYSPISFYDTIIENLKCDAHTLCLLDIRMDENKLMSVKEACKILEEIDRCKGNRLKRLTCVALCGVSGESERIVSFEFKDYKQLKGYPFPQSLIICGNLNEFEKCEVDEYKL